MDFHRPEGARPFLYAHRGAIQNAPENTILAFEHAFDQGADGVELDVRCCGTGEVVVFHDVDFDRFGGDQTLVNDLSFADVRSRDVGKGLRVPTLDEALDVVIARNGRLNIEVKGNRIEPDDYTSMHELEHKAHTARAVAAVMLRRSAADRARCAYSTFDPVVFLGLRMAGVGPLAFLFDAKHTGKRRGPVLARMLGPDGLHPHHPLITPERMRAWKRRGAFVNAWTVDDPALAKNLMALGVDGLITDDVPALRRSWRP